jgi:hypothetical protein
MLELALGGDTSDLVLLKGNEVPQRQRKNHVLLNMSLTGSNATRADAYLADQIRVFVLLVQRKAKLEQVLLFLRRGDVSRT